MRQFRFAIFAVIAVAALAVGANSAKAQALSGVTGVVTDATGGVIAGVSVSLTNPQTGYEASKTTNDVGSYEFLQVPPGSGYTLTFSKDNFKTFQITNVLLGVAVTETRNAQLEVGAASQKVEVAAEGEATINTTDASVGNVVEGDRIQDLPFQFRLDIGNVLALQPGVQAEEGNPYNDANGSVTGARADQQTLVIDGLDVTDETIGQAFYTISRAPLDSVQEVRTVVGNGDSTYGRASSAQVEIVTKSGTNNYHGSLREYNRNTDFAANTFFNNSAGVPRGQLIRNQFGGDIGGPIKKDKLFFFFNYDGLRQTSPAETIQNVPVDAVRAGGINYINSNAGCTSAARLNTNPSCITTIPATGPNSVQSFDPAGIGTDPAILALFSSRYPEPNFPTGGDGINTEGFIFNAPDRIKDNTFIGRVDYNFTSKQKLFARGTWDRDAGDYSTQQFPGDPEAVIGFISHNRSWVVGHTWQISNSVVNNVYAGITRSVQFYPSEYAPSAPNLFGYGYYTDLTAPYGDFRGQGRNVGVPQVREQVSWAKGRHTFEFGGDLRWIREYSSVGNSINAVTVGSFGFLVNLDPSLRPSDIYNTPTDLSAENNWDGMLPILLGNIPGINETYNYNLPGAPLSIGSPAVRHWAYNEEEFYAQDNWKVRSDLSILVGLRWQYHGIPWEQNGYEGIGNLSLAQLFDPRLANDAAGINGNDAAPLMSYGLGGSKNNAPGYYRPDYKDFAPRIGLAYSPSAREGILGKIFGDRKTSIRAGAGIVYDRVLNTLEFELDEENFLFSNQLSQLYGAPGDPETSLQTSPRFTGTSTPPSVAASTLPRPYTPNVDQFGNPIGLSELGGFPNFFNFDKNLRTPYAITASLGIQRELKGGFILEADYFGRFGRRLVAIGDAAQQLNFKDPTSGQTLKNAFGSLETQLQSGVPSYAVSPQPWFENQVGAAAQANYGATCPQFFQGAGLTCTQVAAYITQQYIPVGDLSSTDEILSEDALLLPNTGLLAQTGSAGYIGNYSASSYNGLIVTLRKRISYNFQFDFNYAYAHSIDNVSEINNNFVEFTATGQGLICDLTNLRTCRGNSDFDARHTISANWVYTLPIGKGQRYGSAMPTWADWLVGGWGISGIYSFHSGYPMNTSTGTYPIDFTMSAPAVYVGPASDIAVHRHNDNGTLQYFSSQTNALAAFTYPFGGGTGNRNVLRGPNYAQTDMGLFKNFQMPWKETQRLQLRADAFNVFNNVSFAPPGTAINDPSTFGVLTGQENSPRVLQVAARFEF